MPSLNHKIDFVLLLTATNANPNGDPLNGNRPREDYEGRGEISDVCIKRKLRNRLQDLGAPIFVQSADRSDDGCRSLNERASAVKDLAELVKSKEADSIGQYARVACEKWYDVRAFGQVFAFKGDSVSVGVRGPVSIHQALSVSPVDIVDQQITKSVNSEPTKDGGKSSDTMGMKHFVIFGLYVVKGSVNCQLAEKTGFSDQDAELLKEALRTLFENDASSARPEGSMEVRRLYWFRHNSPSGQYPSAQVHRSIQVRAEEDIIPACFEHYQVEITPLDGLAPEIFSI